MYSKLNKENLSLIVNSGIDSMDNIFTSNEFFNWFLNNHTSHYQRLHKIFLANSKSAKIILDTIYNLIRKSCKIEKISILEILIDKGMIKLNYVLIKNQNNKV